MVRPHNANQGINPPAQGPNYPLKFKHRAPISRQKQTNPVTLQDTVVTGSSTPACWRTHTSGGMDCPPLELTNCVSVSQQAARLISGLRQQCSRFSRRDRRLVRQTQHGRFQPT